MTLWQLSACEATDKIRSGEVSSVELVSACIDHISATDAQIGAWAFVDKDLAVSNAGSMDDIRKRGRAVGALHGVPIGLADLFDTSQMPTGWGLAAHSSRRPERDCAVVDRMREAGAVCLGKTSTTALDGHTQSNVRNPHNLQHGAGGSAAGSAAAVAAGHVPLAVALQSNGAVIGSASNCGVYAFKPTRGMISRTGCLSLSPSVDQVGVLGRSLDDIAVLVDCLASYDPSDPASFARPRPRASDGYRSEPPVEPCFAWVELESLESLPEATRQGLEELIQSLADQVERVPAPKSFSEIARHHQTVQDYEFANTINSRSDLTPDQLDAGLQSILQRAQAVSAEDYHLARAMLIGAEEFFQSFFYDYDAIIAPAFPGEAPKPGDTQLDTDCSTIWTFAGLPCLSMPILAGETGLPVGVQLVGSAEEDDRLFRTAAWLERHLQEDIADDA